MTSLVSEKIHQILQSFKIYTNFCTVDTLIFIDSKIKHGFCIIFTDAVNTTAGVFDVKLVRTGCLNLGISIGGDKLGDLWIADLIERGCYSLIVGSVPRSRILQRCSPSIARRASPGCREPVR